MISMSKDDRSPDGFQWLEGYWLVHRCAGLYHTALLRVPPAAMWEWDGMDGVDRYILSPGVDVPLHCTV